jgi:hypothetical protein
MSNRSGPPSPHGTAVVVKSGPHSPHGASPAPGPQPSPGGSSAGSGGGAASGTAAATAEAKEPGAETREDTVSLTLSIPRPEPFSVFVKSDEGGGVQVDSIEIRICEDDQAGFTALMEADQPVSLNEPHESHVFPLSEKRLKRRLKAGETVEVRVHYIAPDYSQIRIGIIEQEHHHKLGRFIEHLFR